MSLKIRGEEVTIKIAVDGVVQTGSLLKVTEFSATPRTEITEEEYLGETESDLDIQHHGWDLMFGVDHQDSSAIDLVEDIISAEIAHTAHPRITITCIYTYREPGARGKMVVYQNVFLKPAEENVGGRKEKVKGKFEGKCKKRSVLNV